MTAVKARTMVKESEDKTKAHIINLSYFSHSRLIHHNPWLLCRLDPIWLPMLKQKVISGNHASHCLVYKTGSGQPDRIVAFGHEGQGLELSQC